MVILMDGRDDLISHTDTENETVGKVIETITQFVAHHDREIVSIIVDGTPIDPENTDERATEIYTQPVHSIAVVQIATEPLFADGVSTLLNLRSGLEKLSDRFIEIATNIQQQKYRTGLTAFITLIDDWRAVNTQFMWAISDMGIDIQMPILNGVTIRQFLQDTNCLFESLGNAFSAQDWVLLSDILEYEISPKITDFGKLIDAVVTHHQLR